ncbi:helix-turn-helix domain-containing protein [Chitinophaga vietnamensis]|uniref:helix-turn-helix domain-containing protein n=1 Tax=Chitinophaga vietnamensis TaxID=2593957 RepID=UPI00117879E9|nr:helix-turn-helix domain-containing protein [Chitinophaga vietnamensis]
MKYYTIPPPDKLREVVRFFWVLESDEPYTHHAMADVCPELVFHYKGQFDEWLHNGHVAPSFIAGLQAQCTHRRIFHIQEGFGIFGVYLYPQAIPLLFNYAASELTNQQPDLLQLLGPAAAALEDKMWQAVNTQQRIAVITTFMEQRLAKHYKEERPVFQAIRDIIEQNGLIKIGGLADGYYLSERTFERQFSRFAGMSPKLFSRIVRFHAAMNQYGNKNKSLTDIALESGYYDQSHFIHDFTAFSGSHPRHYFSGLSDATRWKDAE